MFEPYEPRDVRVQLLLNEREAAEIDAFRKAAKIRTRNEAIRSLLKAGLQVWEAQRGSNTENKQS